MGKMKDLFIEKINNDRNGPDDTDWNAPEPQAVQSDGKKLWIIPSSKDGVEYKIWAFTYQQAMQLLPMIESF